MIKPDRRRFQKVQNPGVSGQELSSPRETKATVFGGSDGALREPRLRDPKQIPLPQSLPDMPLTNEAPVITEITTKQR
jgi:hypothetical protein